jgi:hypothetical protein
MPNAERQAKVLVLSMALLLSGAALMIHPASAQSYNNVQVFVNTSASHPYNFQFAAYNLTGSLIASYQGPYPAAAFELPAGGYLFTVSATGEYSPQIGYACPMLGGVAQGTSSSPPMAHANGSTQAVIPIRCHPPSSEYGYATATISGAQTINIATRNVTTFPTTQVTVKVSYLNGTAAANASVYGSVVGEWSWWWSANSSVTMGAQTDGNGIAHLVVPDAPTVITAWQWVPLPSGTNGTTPTPSGGQKANTTVSTVYWQPAYIGLSGSGLLIPPQSGINLTLTYQPPDYWVMPAATLSKGAYVGAIQSGTVASQPNGVPSLASPNSGTQSSSQSYLPARIPAIQQLAGTGSSAGPGFFGVDTLVVAAVVFIAAVLAVTLLATRRHSLRPPTPTG